MKKLISLCLLALVLLLTGCSEEIPSVNRIFMMRKDFGQISNRR